MLTLEAPAGLRQRRPEGGGEIPSGQHGPGIDQALGGESTLDELIVGAWEGLTARRVVACVVCCGSMSPQQRATAHPVTGRCQGCGCTLS